MDARLVAGRQVSYLVYYTDEGDDPPEAPIVESEQQQKFRNFIEAYGAPKATIGWRWKSPAVEIGIPEGSSTEPSGWTTRAAGWPALAHATEHIEIDEIETGAPTRWLRITATPTGTDGSILVVVADITEAFAFQGMKWESTNADEADIFNQWAAEVDKMIDRQSQETDLATRKKFIEKELEVAGMLHKAGVPFLAGTDTPAGVHIFPGFSLHEELELLVEDAGLTPLQALQAATINATKFLRLSDSLGAVEEGKIADLVLLKANPLENISNTRNIAAVVVNGRYLSQKALRNMLAKAAANMSGLHH